MRRLIALSFALALAAPSSAPAERVLAPEAEQAGLSAVGRLNLGGEGFCTATLIAPRIVVTAAHCLFHPRTGKMRRPGSLHFVAGYRMGEYAAHARGAEIAAHPDYHGGVGTAPAFISVDIAVIALEEAVTTAAPARLGAAPAPGEVVRVVSYGADRPEAPSVEKGCEVLSAAGPVMRTSCEAAPGVSGAPVLREGADGLEVIGVVAAGRGSRSLAVLPGAEIGSAVERLIGRHGG